jgi:hypothetical protein
LVGLFIRVPLAKLEMGPEDTGSAYLNECS